MSYEQEFEEVFICLATSVRLDYLSLDDMCWIIREESPVINTYRPIVAYYELNDFVEKKESVYSGDEYLATKKNVKDVLIEMLTYKRYYFIDQGTQKVQKREDPKLFVYWQNKKTK